MSGSSSSNSTTPVTSTSVVPSATTCLTDIQYLLHLETLKRFKEDDANIRRQVDEKMRQYQEAQAEYVHWYSKYVNLIKLCMTRNVLEQENPLDDSQIEQTKHIIDSIAKKVMAGNMIDYIMPEVLELLKKKLAASEKYENLEQLQQESDQNKAAVRAIHTTTETVETTLESAIVQGFDYFLSELQAENFEKS